MKQKSIFTGKKSYYISLAFKVLGVAVLLGLDLFTKIYFENRYNAGQGDILVWSGVFSFTFTRNTGAAFSMFSNSTLLLTLLSAVFVVAFFVYDFFMYRKNGWYFASFILIVSGAIGNLIDRASLGYVRDFIRLDFMAFPIFNVADSCLTVGIVCYAIFILFYYHPNKKEN